MIQNTYFNKERQKVPIKSWVTDLEGGALEQAKNLANLPFVFKHVALMPDAHQGFGMPIGGVLATKGYIIPNAVGVDIGCFSGDTKIPLLNGTQKTLKELYEIYLLNGKDVYVYSLDENLELVVGRATPKLTRKNAEIIEITISGGEIIRCTPDHRFMLLDGSYKEARELSRFDSLMPLYRSYQSRDGYERIKTTSGKGIITHQMVAKQFLGDMKKSDLIHHKDENWFNNDPQNLEYKDRKLHSKEHHEKDNLFKTEKFKEDRLKKLKENGFYSPEFKEKKKEIAIKNISKYNQSDKKKEQDKLSGKRGKETLIKYNKSEKGRLKSSENGKKYGFGKNKSNHKVLARREFNVREDVYCLTVEKYHNFALASGVFVHNCGMCASKSKIKVTEISKEQLKKIIGRIRELVPVGFTHHKEAQDLKYMPNAKRLYAMDSNNHLTPICAQEFNNALTQVGTLGGGNHFIELQKDEENNLWIMIHSGSRNLGKTVADVYNKKAIELNKAYASIVDKNQDLAFLPLSSEEAKDYIEEMNYCVEFALCNRKLMMERCQQAVIEILGNTSFEFINIPHNYARIENHFGENVMVHRKGATSARAGEIGIIPGSQGTCSYIVEGLGNPESFESCSHGAGRKMGRNVARNTLNLQEEIKKLDDKGIIHAVRNTQDLDEAPGSYKDIDTVMENQKDLVKILVKLEPLGVVKG